MYYSVIYEVQVPDDIPLLPYVPDGGFAPHGPWMLTDRANGKDTDYAYLDEGNDERHWSHHKSKQRKYIAFLTQQQFDDLIDKVGLFAERCETGGMLGAPMPDCKIDIGWSPAIAFRSDDQDAITSAYACPIPSAAVEGRRQRELSESDWERLRCAVIRKYR